MTSNPKPNVRLPTGLQPTTEGELDCFFPQKSPLTAQPVPPHAGRAKPGSSSDRALQKASSYRACNQVLGSAPSLPLEISHYGFSHPPVGVCSSPVGPKALPGACLSKRLREDCRIALRQAGLLEAEGKCVQTPAQELVGSHLNLFSAVPEAQRALPSHPAPVTSLRTP